MIFNIRGTQSQIALINEAIARCKFDFDQLLPGLQRQTGKTQIDVSFARLGSGVGGWASSDGSIQISSDLSTLDAESVFLMESGHTVDFFWLNDAQRKSIMELFHPGGADNHQWFGTTSYFSQVGEAWTTLFTWATSDLRPDASNYTHGTNADLATKLLPILSMSPTPPIPPVPPVPPVPPNDPDIAKVHADIDAIFATAIASAGLFSRGPLKSTQQKVHTYLSNLA